MLLETVDDNDDLDALIAKQDHMNVLRFIRFHQLRRPEVVVKTCIAWLGPDLNDQNHTRLSSLWSRFFTGGSLSSLPSSSYTLARLAALEQLCLAALDVNNIELAQLALQRLHESTNTANTTTNTTITSTSLSHSENNDNTNKIENTSSSVRLQLLQGRIYEATQQYDRAHALYAGILETQPGNAVALQRQYCIKKAQVHVVMNTSQAQQEQQLHDQEQEEEIIDPHPMMRTMMEAQQQQMQALNAYLEQHMSDASAWFELAGLLQELGDFSGTVYALEEVVLLTNVPTDAAALHVRIAECLASIDSTCSNVNDDDRDSNGDSRKSHSHSRSLGTSRKTNRMIQKKENLVRARQHMAQALELDPANRRAQFGLVTIANAYLQIVEAIHKNTKDNNMYVDNVDELHDRAVAQEMVRYGAEQVMRSYRPHEVSSSLSSSSSRLYARVEALMEEYTKNNLTS